MIHTIHGSVELGAEERAYCKSILEDTGLTEYEAETMIEDFEMGF